MKNKAVIDHIIGTANSRMAEEMSTLLGQTVSQSNLKVQLTTKEDYFAEPQGKAALTRMKIAGEGEGESYVLLSQDAALTLGGTLIMLPPDEIESRIKSGSFDGEEADAFGEIANIIAGAYTTTFLDLYKKSLRFIKTSVETVIPTKVDVDDEAPFPPGDYCHARCSLALEEAALGFLDILIPAEVLGLKPQSEPAPPESPSAEKPVATGPKAPAKPQPAPSEAPAEASGPPPTAAEAPKTKKPAKTVPEEVLKQVLNKGLERVSVELSALLGHELKFKNLRCGFTTKEDFFEAPREMSVLSRFNLESDAETGQALLLTRVSDSIILGGTLIMLPPDELETRVKEGTLDGEEKDAFNEVANIVAGALNACFRDLYPVSLRISKSDIETVAPTKVDADSDVPCVPGTYYELSADIRFEAYSTGRLELIFPPGLLCVQQPDEAAARVAQPEAKRTVPAAQPRKTGSTEQAPAVSDREDEGQTAEEFPADAEDRAPAVILVLSNDEKNSSKILNSLETAELPCLNATLQDNFKEIFLRNSVRGVFLVMKEVDEQGLAVAIKLQSANQKRVPVIMAGPEWTRSKVIKAVHYGAQDILVTPANSEEIAEKIRQHMK